MPKEVITTADVGELRIVEGVMAATSSLKPTGKARAAAIETAMGQAVTACLASGVSITDSDTIRAAMLTAREAVLRGRATQE